MTLSRRKGLCTYICTCTDFWAALRQPTTELRSPTWTEFCSIKKIPWRLLNAFAFPSFHEKRPPRPTNRYRSYTQRWRPRRLPCLQLWEKVPGHLCLRARPAETRRHRGTAAYRTSYLVFHSFSAPDCRSNQSRPPVPVPSSFRCRRASWTKIRVRLFGCWLGVGLRGGAR